MDYTFCYYKGIHVSNAKEYLNSTRGNFFNINYNPENREKMLEEMERIIDFNKSVDLYAFAHLLFDERSESSLSRAFCILDMLVSWNYAPAKYLLGQMYYYGLSVEKDLKKFIELSMESAKENFIPAKNALSVAYFNGYGVSRNDDLGRKYLKECEDAKYGQSYANLGFLYYKGTNGFPKDLNKAFEYYKLSSYQFNRMGTYSLALMYFGGFGCTKDVKKGIYELINAAMLGDVRAQNKLGDIYYFGNDVEKDNETAYKYYLMAAKNGNPYAMYSVGYMIVKKEKLYVDKYVGLDWLRKAAYLGDESAKKFLNEL